MKRYIHYIFILTIGIILNACEDSFPIGGVPSLTNDYMGDYDSYVSVTDVSLNLSSLSLYKGESETLSVTVLPKNATNRDVTWTSSNTSVATVDDNGKVTAVKSGTTTITVTSVSDISKYAKCKVTVTDAASVVHEYVDLGLTSGTLWATCNIGAKNPEDYGSYFAWGEITTKSSYTKSNYSYSSNPSTLPADKDAARANWSGNWCMPTLTEFQELKAECEWTWTTMNGKSGYKVSSLRNSNYIFLPAAGMMFSSSLEYASFGNYWSSTLRTTDTSYAYALVFTTNGTITPAYYYNRYDGLSVRPVLRKEIVVTGGHEYVDLGLTSGTLWATCNIGASSLEDCGSLFAWGETSTKSEYTWYNYKYSNGSTPWENFTKYVTESEWGSVDGKTVLELSDDAAHINWGGDWCMPTSEDAGELRDECVWKWEMVNNVEVCRITSKRNNNYILLPVTSHGIHSDSGELLPGWEYWTSNGSDQTAIFWGFALKFGDLGDIPVGGSGSRCGGLPVRPVIRK